MTTEIYHQWQTNTYTHQYKYIDLYYESKYDEITRSIYELN